MPRKLEAVPAVRGHLDGGVGLQLPQQVTHRLLNQGVVVDHDRAHGETSGPARKGHLANSWGG